MAEPAESVGAKCDSRVPKEMKINVVSGNKCSCPIKISKLQFRALVDTGADLSLISSGCLAQLKMDENLLQAPTVNLSTVNGQSLHVVGRVTLSVKLGGTVCRNEFHIVDGINSSVILGYDFITSHDVQLSFSENQTIMRLGKECILLEPENHIRSLLRLADDLTVPPLTVSVCRVRSKMNKVGTSVISAIDTGFISEEPGLLVSNCVVDVKNSKMLPAQIVNATNKTFHLKKGNVIGKLTSVNEQQIQNLVDSPCMSDDGEKDEINVPDEFRLKIEKLIEANSDLFAKRNEDLGRTHVVEMNIDTGTHPPINLKAYRAPLNKREIIENQIDDMLKANVVRPSRSPWAFPVVIVGKKDGSKRFCVDYRQLNAITTKYQWNLAHIDDILATLGHSKFFSCCDLKSGYWQIPVRESDKQKTAFTTHKGLYEFNCMPFGLCNAPSIFSELMERVVGDLKFAIAYLDDLIIFSETEEEHLKHLKIVFGRLREANLRLKRSKCEFFKESLPYLGHKIDKNGVWFICIFNMAAKIAIIFY